MEILLLKALLNSVTQYFHLSSQENINSELVQRHYKKAEDILKLLKPILDAILGSELASNEVLNKYFEELSHSVAELRELFESWQPMMSKVYFVIQVEEIILRIQSSSIDILQSLQYNNQELPDELSSASLEHCVQKISHIGDRKTSSFIREAARDLLDGAELSSETLVKLAESLCLKSNYEILIEAVALEKLKETAEQAEKTDEAEDIDQLIALVTGMHDRLIMIKQSQSSSPIPIPADFCCPLSLELMTDPVIVASGQTYERAFIRQWLELGLTVCPKTRQILAHTNLIPNYTVKALIANWCESNNVKLPDPTKSMSLNQPSPLLVRSETGRANDLSFKSNQPVSPESGRCTGSPARNLAVSSGVRWEGISPLHPRSTSDGSMSSVSGNGHSVDMGRLSLETSEENIANLEERIRDSLGQTSASPARKELSNALVADELVSTSHKRAASASSGYATANPPSGVSGDRNGNWQAQTHVKGHTTDVSGESKSDATDSASMSARPREPEFSPRLVEARPRNQMIWRRPSDRFVPKIVPSPSVELRNDLSAIETQVKKLVEDLKSDSLETQREATAELRVLARHDMDNRVVIANCSAINLLVNLLRSSDTKIQENAVTALLNLSINDNNKIAIANADSIEPLIYVLNTGSPEAKENSAATLFSLSVIEENKVKIGRSGAIGPLVDLLGNGTPRGKKDAATALFNLSIYHENKARIVQAGAVKYLVDLMDPAAGMVDKAVAVLANLATIQEGRAEIGQQGGIPVLVEVVELGSQRGKENAAAALLQLCTNSSKHCSMVLQEGAVPPLVALSQSGTPRAKEKAQSLLSYFRNQRHGNAPRG